jgi:hypothetical protein
MGALRVWSFCSLLRHWLDRGLGLGLVLVWLGWIGFVHSMHDCIASLEFDFYMPSKVLSHSDSILSFG